MNKKLKIGLLILAVVIVIGGVYGIFLLQRTAKYQQAVDETTIIDVDLSEISDGNYEGSYDVDMISATVQVEVENHEIKNIELIEHNNDRGEKAESIVNDIINQQKIKVDTVTGATNSSKVIQKAVQNALLQE